MDDCNDAPQVAEALQAIIDRVQSLLSKPRVQITKPALKAESASIKLMLKELKDIGTIDGIKRQRSPNEDSFFYPAVWRSSARLSTLSANTNPQAVGWQSAWQDVQNEFQARLDRLRKECP